MVQLKERTILNRTVDTDHGALAAACDPGVALCTVVDIDGSFSRRLGAQLAVGPDGRITGSLADGCLESQLAADCRALDEPQVVRYGRGSPRIDFRLPCGGGLDILLDPKPDRDLCRAALDRLAARQLATLSLAPNRLLAERKYLPALSIRAFGEGPELAALREIAAAAQIDLIACDKNDLTLGQASDLPPADRWTAVALLFHDHEWELPLIEEALSGDAFFIGAQGGSEARQARTTALLSRNVPEESLARLVSPIGAIPNCKTPTALALSALTQIVGAYEELRAAV